MRPQQHPKVPGLGGLLGALGAYDRGCLGAGPQLSLCMAPGPPKRRRLLGADKGLIVADRGS